MFGQRPGLVALPLNQPLELSGSGGERKLLTFADTVATYPVVWGVWSKLVKTLSTTDIGVFEDKADGSLPKRVYGTELEKLLREPFPGKGLVNTLQWLFNPYFVEGNSVTGLYYGENGREAGPVGLVPLDWRQLSALALPGGPVEKWISHQMGGEPRALSPEDVIHLAWDSPNGNGIGLSPLQSLRVSVRLRDSSDRYQIASFDNGSRPAGAIVIPADAKTTPEERKEMRAAVQDMHQGVDSAFRLAVLSGGTKWEPMSFSAVEADLDGTRERTTGEVCVAYDVRRSVIEDTGAGGRSLQETLGDFQRSLIPHARLAEDVLKRQLIDRVPAWKERGLVVKFDLSELQRGTYREELEANVYAYVNGILAEDEARAGVGRGPSGNVGADKPLVPHAQLDPNKVDNRTLPPSSETTPDRSTRPVREVPGSNS